ncbi:transmembrane protein 231-like [Aphidius gifuensis]|uniref:transmembrane protein 231-like n=1 Tax=Aphidius gifuensis TaxID=684658 RepID=UPI001CDC1AE1|nr:transmembrane protein 231-like [Aphidius gifuensis]XP_044015734.1 transmembrane protein 231-like [Aphidius gifuensis]
MSAFAALSVPVTYKFKIKSLSIGSLVVFIFGLTVILLPLIISNQAGGLWIKNRMYIEIPRVSFTHKYLLLVEKDFHKSPLVCSSFTTYQKNRIDDECLLFKIQEIDYNKDQQIDLLKFEAQFYSNEVLRSVTLSMYFQFDFMEVSVSNIEASAIFDVDLPTNVQKVHMIGHLKLNSEGPIHQKTSVKVLNNENLELGHSLDEVLPHNSKKVFPAQFTNTNYTFQIGHSSDEPIVISGEIFHTEQSLNYQPQIWEELKGAWIQYFSILAIFVYIVKHILEFLFRKSYLKGYIVTSWHET